MPRHQTPVCYLAASILVSVSMVAASEQQAPPQVGSHANPRFDVVSVKPNPSGKTVSGGLGFPPGGRFSATNVTLRELIGAVYGPEFIGEGRIVDAPEWVFTERFDVEAKSDRDPPPAERRLMVRTLLADSFELKLHQDDRDAQVLALRLVQSGRSGAGLKESRAECPKMDGPPPPPPAGGAATPAHRPCGVGTEPGKLTGYGAATAQFARILAGLLRRPVIDATEMMGRYDFEVQYGHIQPEGAAKGVSIFKALQDQLGLTLAEERRRMSVLVIDHAERPKG
jgi:uncharacterized protein (TIGR03435 family)